MAAGIPLKDGSAPCRVVRRKPIRKKRIPIHSPCRILVGRGRIRAGRRTLERRIRTKGAELRGSCSFPVTFRAKIGNSGPKTSDEVKIWAGRGSEGSEGQEFRRDEVFDVLEGNNFAGMRKRTFRSATFLQGREKERSDRRQFGRDGNLNVQTGGNFARTRSWVSNRSGFSQGRLFGKPNTSAIWPGQGAEGKMGWEFCKDAVSEAQNLGNLPGTCCPTRKRAGISGGGSGGCARCSDSGRERTMNARKLAKTETHRT